MKKKFALCCILVMLVFTTITVNADVRGYRTTWDCIWFGTYPQTQVKFKYPIRLTKIQLKSVKNNKKRTISVKWKKIKDAKKYKIQFATNKKFKKAKVRICKKTSYQIKKLKKGKTYYVRVRAVNGKKQGKWSKVSKIKIRR